jgi:sugar/nucleoside kinase (ribokinase family)
MLGRLGDDVVGQVIADRLRAEVVDLSGRTVDPAAPTAYMLRQSRTADQITVSCYRHGSAETVVKRDQHGALAQVGSQALAAPAISVTTLDPIADEDAFIAGYLSARLEGLHDGPS